MSIGVKIRFKPNTLPMALADMAEGHRSRAAVLSFNYAARGMRTIAKREIAKHVNISITDIGARLFPIWATAGTLNAGVRGQSKWFSASYPGFKTKDTGSGGWKSRTGNGVFWTPWKDHTQHVGKGFMAKMRSGHNSIYVRKGSSRLPIEHVGWGPNVARELERADKPTRTLVLAEGVARFGREYPRQYDRLVADAKSKFGL